MLGDRFFLLPIASEYAKSRLGTDTTALQGRHAEHYLMVLEAADKQTRTKDHQKGFSVLRGEFENMRAGVQWAVKTQVNDIVLRYGQAFSGNLTPLRRAAAQVEFCEWALQAAKRIRSPKEEARAQNNLGNAYGDLPTGDRGENLKQAIRCFEAALRVRTERDFPVGWAMTQNNLGNAYGNLPTGDRGENLKQAIQCYEAALRVYTEHDFPVAWATTQNNLGNAYGDVPTGDRGENLKQAIQSYEAALRVRTEHDFPVAWATTQNNLGIAYDDLPTGDRGENLKQAIQCYEAALRVRTERDFPVDWATTQNNLGIAYENLPMGEPGANFRKAMECYENAVRGYRAAHLENEATKLEARIAKLRSKQS